MFWVDGQIIHSKGESSYFGRFSLFSFLKMFIVTYIPSETLQLCTGKLVSSLTYCWSHYLRVSRQTVSIASLYSQGLWNWTADFVLFPKKWVKIETSLPPQWFTVQLKNPRVYLKLKMQDGANLTHVTDNDVIIHFISTILKFIHV